MPLPPNATAEVRDVASDFTAPLANGDIEELCTFESDLGYYGVAKLAVSVADEGGEVTYRWVSDDPGVESEYEEVGRAVAEAAE